MAFDSGALLFAVVLCGGLMVATCASTQGLQASAMANLSSAAVAAVVVGSVAVFLAQRTRSSEGKASPKDTILAKTPAYEIITGDRQRLQTKIDKIRLGGMEQLVVVSDFDMTLTSFLMPDG